MATFDFQGRPATTSVVNSRPNSPDQKRYGSVTPIWRISFPWTAYLGAAPASCGGLEGARVEILRTDWAGDLVQKVVEWKPQGVG